MKNKSNKGLIVLVVVLIIIIIGLGSYICYDKFINNNTNSNEQNQNQGFDDNTEESKLSEEEVNSLNNSLIIDGADANLFAKSNINIDNIDEAQLISYVITKYGEENDWQKMLNDFENNSSEDKFHKVTSVSKSEIDNMIKKIFNVSKTFELKDKSYYQYNCWEVWYSKTDDVFYLDASTAGSEFGTLKASLIKYEQDDNNLYTYNKLINCHYSSGQCYLTNDKTINTNADSLIMKNNRFDYEYILNKYSDQLNTYKTTFKKASDGRYYWYSSEIVNE